jgi:hypothetical protein
MVLTWQETHFYPSQHGLMTHITRLSKEYKLVVLFIPENKAMTFTSKEDVCF